MPAKLPASACGARIALWWLSASAVLPLAGESYSRAFVIRTPGLFVVERLFGERLAGFVVAESKGGGLLARPVGERLQRAKFLQSGRVIGR